VVTNDEKKVSQSPAENLPVFVGLGKNIGDSQSLSHVHLVDLKLAKAGWQALSDGI